MIIRSLSMTKAKITVGNTDLFLYEIGGHLAIMEDVEEESRVRFIKGSLDFRMKKGMKLKQAIKDLISKAKGFSTEIILIDTRD